MTPSEHLGELKGIDPETYEALRNYPIYCSDDEALTVNLLESRNNILVMDALQGCIQRACERRGWPFHVAYYPPEGPNAPYYQAYIWPALKCHTAQADSAAEALLAAYIAAVKKEAKR